MNNIETTSTSVPFNEQLKERAFPTTSKLQSASQLEPKYDPDQFVGFQGGVLFGGLAGTLARSALSSNDPYGFTKDDITPTKDLIQYIAPKVGYRKEAVQAVLTGLKSPQDVDEKIKIINQNIQYDRLKGEAGFFDNLASGVSQMLTSFEALSLFTRTPVGLIGQAAVGGGLGVLSSMSRQDITGVKTDPLMEGAFGAAFGFAGGAAQRFMGDTIARSRVVQYARKNGTKIDPEYLEGRWGSQTVAELVDKGRQVIQNLTPTVTVQGALKNPVTKATQEFIDKTFRAEGGVKKVLNPDGTFTYIQVGSKGKTAEEYLRDYSEQLWRVRQDISSGIQELKAAGWVDDQIRQAVYQYAETGAISSKSSIGQEQIAKVATIARGLFDSRWTQMNKRGLIESKLDNYFPVMVDNQRRMDFINSFPGSMAQKQEQAIQKLADNFYNSVNTPEELQKFRAIFKQDVLNPIVQATNQKIDNAIAKAQKRASRETEAINRKSVKSQKKLQARDKAKFNEADREIRASQRQLQKSKEQAQKTLTKQLNALQKEESVQGTNFVNQIEELQRSSVREVQQMKANTDAKIKSLTEQAESKKAQLRKIWGRNQAKTNQEVKAHKAKAAQRRNALKTKLKSDVQKANKKTDVASKNAAIKAAQNRYTKASKQLQKKLKEQRSAIQQKAKKRGQALQKKSDKIDDDLKRESLRQKGQLQKRITKHNEALQVRMNRLQQRTDKVVQRIAKRKAAARTTHTTRVTRASQIHTSRVQRINSKYSTSLTKSQETKAQKGRKALQALRQIDGQLALKVERILQDNPSLSEEQIQELFQEWLKKEARHTAVGWIDAGQSMKRGLLQGHDGSSKFTKRRMPFRHDYKDADGFSPNRLRVDIDSAVDYYGRRSAGDLTVFDTYGYKSYDQASVGFRQIAMQEAKARKTPKGGEERQKAMKYLLDRLYGRATSDTHRDLKWYDAMSQSLRLITLGGANGFMGLLNYTQVAEGVKAYGASFVLQSIPMVGQLFAKWDRGNIDLQDRKLIQSILFGQQIKQLQLFSDIRRLQQQRYSSSQEGLTSARKVMANVVAGINYGVNKLPTTRFLQASQTSIVSTVQAKMLDDLIRLAYGDPAKGKQFFSKKALQRLSIDDAQMDQLMKYLRDCFTYTKDGAKLKGQGMQILNSNPNALNTLRRLGDYCADQVILRPSLADGFFKWDPNSGPLRNLLLQFKSFAIRSYQKRLVKATHRATQGQQWSQAMSLAISGALVTIGNFGFTSIRTMGMDQEERQNYWRRSFGVGSFQQLLDDPYKIINVIATNGLRTSAAAPIALALNTGGFGTQAKTTSSSDSAYKAEDSDQPMTLSYFTKWSLGNLADMVPSARTAINLGNVGVGVVNTGLLASQGYEWDSQESQKNRQRLARYFGYLLPNWTPFRQTVKDSLVPPTNYIK